MSDPLVEVRGLKVGYPDRAGWALDGVDLEVADGEQVLVVGASGSGKSTLLHVLAGLLPRVLDADIEGSVRVGTHDPTDTPIPVLSRTLGLLRQDPVSQVALPLVEDELAFVLESRATAPDRIAGRIDAALDHVGLRALRHRRTSTLSGGELQRVALAATLLGDPALLLLDEPTAMLDPAAAQEVGRLLDAERSRATVLIEHRLSDLPRLPSRVLVLDRGGRVRAAGATAETLAQHATWLARSGVSIPLGVELALASRRTVVPDDVTTTPDVLVRLAAPALGRLGREGAPSIGPIGAPLLSARGATFVAQDGGPTLVDDVDLELREGEVTAVLGANGSGKTSLLLGLAGFLPLAEGRVDGSTVGLVFQHPEHQLIGRTVAEDIAVSFGDRRRRRPDTSARVADAAARFDLAGLETADPFRLSGGQKRRLSIASMAVTDHRVVLLDEPTFGQDQRTSRRVERAIRGLAEDGRAVALTTHDLRLAARLADRLLVLSGGRLVAAGTPGEVLRDVDGLAQHGIGVPPLLAWWARDASELDLRALLRGLDRATTPGLELAVAP